MNEWMTFSLTHNPDFKVTVLFKGECLKTVHFILSNSCSFIYFTSTQCSADARSLSAIAEPLVSLYGRSVSVWFNDLFDTLMNYTVGDSGSQSL